MKFHANILTLVALAATATSYGQAATSSLTSSAFLGASNTEFFPYSIPVIDNGFSDTGAPVSASGSQSFGGSNGNGDFDTMNFSGTGYASAQYGKLKTSASGEVENSFYNSSNPWYWNTNTNELNEEGTPDVFISVGQATYNDVFTYTNYGPAVTVNFFYQISGLFSGASAYHSLSTTNDGDFDYIYIDNSGGNVINQTWVSKNFSIGDGILEHETNTLSSFAFETQHYPDGTYMDGSADFSSTVTLTGMELRDINGGLVEGWSMTSASGTIYPVPEPATMTILGLAALATARKRKKA